MTLEEIKEKKAALKAEMEELTTLENDLLLQAAGVQRGDIVVSASGCLAIVLGASGNNVEFADVIFKQHQLKFGTLGIERSVDFVRDTYTRIGQARLTHDNQLVGACFSKHFSCADNCEDSNCCANDPA